MVAQCSLLGVMQTFKHGIMLVKMDVTCMEHNFKELYELLIIWSSNTTGHLCKGLVVNRSQDLLRLKHYWLYALIISVVIDCFELL